MRRPAAPPKRIVAISLAPPGHFRGGFFWQSGQPSYADLSPRQERAVRDDGRLQVIEGAGADALPVDLVARAVRDESSDNRILLEAERVTQVRKRREARAARRLTAGRGGR